jgi:hypothetical protein
MQSGNEGSEHRGNMVARRKLLARFSCEASRRFRCREANGFKRDDVRSARAARALRRERATRAVDAGVRRAAGLSGVPARLTGSRRRQTKKADATRSARFTTSDAMILVATRELTASSVASACGGVVWDGIGANGIGRRHVRHRRNVGLGRSVPLAARAGPRVSGGAARGTRAAGSGRAVRSRRTRDSGGAPLSAEARAGASSGAAIGCVGAVRGRGVTARGQGHREQEGASRPKFILHGAHRSRDSRRPPNRESDVAGLFLGFSGCFAFESTAPFRTSSRTA